MLYAKHVAVDAASLLIETSTATATIHFSDCLSLTVYHERHCY